jgi:uncharacterized caspase-like protein
MNAMPGRNDDQHNSVGRRVALVVGVNYAPESDLSQLECAENDAQTVAVKLRQAECRFELANSPLCGHQATTHAVKEALLDMVGELGSDDLLLFYFSGHGKPVHIPAEELDVYLVTYDFKEKRIKQDENAHLSLRWLQDKVLRCTNVGQVLLLLDCCFPAIGEATPDPYFEELKQRIEYYLNIQSSGNTPGVAEARWSITAASPTQKAFEKDGSGYFTRALIQALDGQAVDNNGYVTVSTVEEYIKEQTVHIQTLGRYGFSHDPKLFWLAHYEHLSQTARQQEERQKQNEHEQRINERIDGVHETMTEIKEWISNPDFFKQRAVSSTTSFDESICEDATVDDLHSEQISSFFERELVQRQDDFQGDLEPRNLLEEFGFVKQGRVRYGALLCFGRKPQDWLGNTRTLCRVWGTDSLQILDTEDIGGDLISQYEKTIRFLQRNLRQGRSFDARQQKEQLEIPFPALREAVANALVHRDYNDMEGTVSVNVFEDRIEITNPGMLLRNMTIDQITSGGNTLLRNPLIARMFYLSGFVERAGTGFPRMQHFLREAGLPEPSIEIDTNLRRFKVVLYRPDHTHLYQQREETPHQQREETPLLARVRFWFSDIANVVALLVFFTGVSSAWIAVQTWGTMLANILAVVALVACAGVVGRLMWQQHSYRKRYLHHLIDQHRFFDVRGLSTQGPHSLMLGHVFVELSIAPQPFHDATQNPIAQVPEHLREGRYTIWDYLAQQHPLVVLGAPGSGKTTLLKFITLMLAARRTTPNQRALSGRVPILLTLRDHAADIREQSDYPIAQAVRDHLARSYGPPLPSGWFERQIDAGRCLILFDGLDEVADLETRKQVGMWVERQMRALGKNLFVITSRPFGYKTNPLSGVTVLEVRPFTTQQVERFVQNWYRANEIMSAQKDDAGVHRLARQGAENLLGRLRTTPALYDLAVNPLLLTMIATVHRYRSSLPGRRVELYAEICEVFLGKRQQAHGQQLDLTPAQKQSVLQVLAYHLMQAQTREITLADALHVIAQPLELVSMHMTGEAFLKDIENSSGLLIERENGVYAFAHLIFQEYLAAAHIKTEGLGDELPPRVGLSWWHETILLYAAQADATAIIAACLEGEQPSVDALSLALRCEEEALHIQPALRQRLTDMLIDAA